MVQVSGRCPAKEQRSRRELRNVSKRVKADLGTWEAEVKWLHKGSEGSEHLQKAREKRMGETLEQSGRMTHINREESLGGETHTAEPLYLGE